MRSAGCVECGSEIRQLHMAEGKIVENLRRRGASGGDLIKQRDCQLRLAVLAICSSK